MSGVVLDLACGKNPSYWRVLGLKNNKRVYLVGVDFNIAYCPTVVSDLTCPLPFKDASAHAVIVSSFLYIISDPKAFLKEVWRVLKPGHCLYLTAPLIFPYTPEPTDHWRFTEDGLRFLLCQAGFVELQIFPVGGRFSAIAYLLSPFLRPRWLVAPLVYFLSLKLDSWTKRFRLPDCPIGYVVKAKKPS